jgi:hypothetical protein
MPNPVIVDFILRGMPAVQNALRTVEQATANAERSATNRAGAAARTRQSLVEREAKAKVAAMMKVDRFVAQTHARSEREAQRAARAEERIAEKKAQTEIRAAERSSRAVQRIKEREFRDLERMGARHQREEERRAALWVRREERKRFIQERDERRNRVSFAQTIGGAGAQGLANAGRRIGGLMSQTAGIVGQLGGGFSIADALDRRQRLNRQSVNLSNAAFTGEGARLDPAELTRRANAASAQVGVDPSELLAAAHAFGSKTGEYSQGLDLMKFFGEVSQGTGASLEDVANTAGILRVQNKALDTKGMRELILGTVRQGQKGSVEFSDLATQAAKITRSSSAFSGNQAASQSKLLGLAQIAMRTGTLSETGTTVSNISMDALKNISALRQKLGPETFTEKGQIARSPDEFVADVMAASGGNLEMLQRSAGKGGFGFGARSMKIFQALAPTYNEAEKQALERGEGPDKARAAGRAAVISDIRSVSAGAMSQEELGENVERIQQTQQFDNAMRELRIAIGEEVLPAFAGLVPVVREVTPSIVDIVKNGVPAIAELIKALGDFAAANKDTIRSLSKHPIGSIIAFELTKSIGQAAIGQGIKVALMKAFGDAGLGPIVQRVLATQLGKAGLVVGTAAVAIEMGMIAIDKEFQKGSDLQNQINVDQAEAATLTARVRKGTATDEEKSQAAALVTKLQGEQRAMQAMHDSPGVIRGMIGGVASFTEEGRAATEREEGNFQRGMGDLVKTMRDLQTAIQTNTDAAGKSPPGPVAGKPPAASGGLVQRTK